MAGNQLLSANPLLKLSISMMIGIAVGRYCGFGAAELLSFAAASLFVLLYGFLRTAPKWVFGVGAVLFMFAAGTFVEYKQRCSMEPKWMGGTRLYEAQLLEVPQHKGSSTKVLAAAVDVDSVLVPGARSQGDAYIYLSRSVEADALEVGDVLRFNSEMHSPSNSGNPAEFDIAGFCYVKGITGSTFVWDGNWEVLGKGEKTLAMHALSVREDVVDWYKELGFDGDGLALLSALTVGEKRDFSRELKENYAAAGASHILALSGLHLGLIYLLLSVLLPLRRRSFWTVVPRELIIVAALWAFAYIAGLPASVVRSAILFTLMSVGRCMRQDVSSLSSLAFAAIVMLLFSPHLLFDISFQLSFSAVFATLLLTPHLQRLLKVDERGVFCRYVLNLLILSLSAQMGTLPFVWYYFGVFPLYFLLTNLFVVPLAFVVMALALLLIATSFFYPFELLFSAILQFVTTLMCDVVSLISSLPGASLALPPIGVLGAACVALLLFVLSYSLINRKWWLTLLAVGCSLVLCVVNVVVDGGEKQLKGVIVYNNNKNPLLHIVAQNGENWLLSTVPQLDAEYEYVSSPYIKREGLREPEWVDSDYTCDEFICRNGVLRYGGLKIKVLADDLWSENIFSEPVDVIVLCRGFLGSVKELAEVYPSGVVLLDASLYKRSRERILRECAALDIEAVDISRSGAVKIVPRGDNFEITPLRGK